MIKLLAEGAQVHWSLDDVEVIYDVVFYGVNGLVEPEGTL